jgi:hypothetical protein
LDVLSIFSRIAMKSKTTGSSKVKSQGSLTWLASYPKSGNTWLRSIIHAGLTGSLDINRLASTTHGFASKVAKFHKGKIVLQSPEEASKFWATCQRRMNFDLNGRKIFLKTHNAAIEFDGEKFPLSNTANGVIYIVRDPRDVIVSYSNHYRIEPRVAFDRISSRHNHIWATNSLERFEFLSSWDRHVLSWYGLSIPKLFLRYEDMLKEPRYNIKKIFKFLNLEPIVGLDKIISLTNFASLSRQEAANGFKEAVNGATFFKQGTSRQWEGLDHALLNEITETFGPAMGVFGYD